MSSNNIFKTFHSVQMVHGTKRAIFELTLGSGDKVYMCSNNLNYIVEVDTAKFIDVWKNGHSGNVRGLATGNEEFWRSDYKFHYAEDGFNEGIENPVPLSSTNTYLLIKEKPIIPFIPFFKKQSIQRIISFTNGTTRTIWLLANKCRVFPVSVNSIQEAYSLAQSVGVTADSFIKTKYFV